MSAADTDTFNVEFPGAIYADDFDIEFPGPPGAPGRTGLSSGPLGQNSVTADALADSADEQRLIREKLGTSVPTRAALAALGAGYSEIVALSEPGREGLFSFDPSNLSAQVAADPLKGLVVPPASAPSGASGAWVRVVSDNRYQAQWWGTDADRTDNQVPINAAFQAIPDGAVLEFPPYDCVCSATCYSRTDHAVHVRGAANRKSRVVVSVATASYYLFQVMSSRSSVKNIGFIGGATGSAAIEPAALAIGKFNYVVPGTGAPVPGTVEDVEVDDVWIDGGDSGIIVGLYYGSGGNGYRPGAPTPNVAAGVYLDAQDVYLIYRVTVRNCRIRCYKNGIGFYGSVDCHEHDNDITILDHTITYFSSCLRVLGSDNLFSRHSRWTYEVEAGGQQGFGLYYALSAIDTAIRIANTRCVIVDHVLTNCAIPFEIQSWSGGSLTLERHKIRNSPASTNGNPLIRMSTQGDISGQKRMRIEGFTRLHIRDLDALGLAQFMVSFSPVKDLVIEGCKWVSNAFTTLDGRYPIEIRDVTAQTDADGAPLAQHGNGLIRIRNNELLSNSPAFGEISITEGIASTKAIVMGNTTVPSTGGGVPRAQMRFEGAAGAKIVTDGATEQAAGTTISPGLNYRYPAGTRALAVSAG